MVAAFLISALVCISFFESTSAMPTAARRPDPQGIQATGRAATGRAAPSAIREAVFPIYGTCVRVMYTCTRANCPHPPLTRSQVHTNPHTLALFLSRIHAPIDIHIRPDPGSEIKKFAILGGIKFFIIFVLTLVGGISAYTGAPAHARAHTHSHVHTFRARSLSLSLSLEPAHLRTHARSRTSHV